MMRLLDSSKDKRGRIRVGFWWSADDYTNASFPRVETCVDRSWSIAQRRDVLAYLRLPGHRSEAYCGTSKCRICSEWNGSADVSDGKYVWPSGFAHYIEEHGVKPPHAFISHVLRRSL